MTPNPRLIRLVAARYVQLQGLFTIQGAVWTLWWGVMMLSGRWLDRADVSDWWALPLSFPLFAFMVLQLRWVQPRLRSYYASRFGRVGGQHVLQVSAGPWTFQAFLMGSLLADAHAPWLTLAVAVSCLAAWPAWIVCRDWPFRWHWLPLLVLGTAAARAMSLMPSYSVALRHLGPWAVAVALAQAFAGLGDHLLLVRTLRGHAVEDNITAEEMP